MYKIRRACYSYCLDQLICPQHWHWPCCCLCHWSSQLSSLHAVHGLRGGASCRREVLLRERQVPNAGKRS